MTITEIKKELYKQKPLAQFEYIKMGIAYYSTNIKNSLSINHTDWATSADREPSTIKNLTFAIPVNDMGTAVFEKEMDAKLLIRWL